LENLYSASQMNLETYAEVGETYEAHMMQLHGRIGRIRYLAYQFASSLLIGVLIAFLGAALNSISLSFIAWLPILSLPLYFASLFIFGRRRLNDLGHSGWFILLTFIPIVNFVFGLYLVFARGDEANNEYGPPPNPTPTLVKIGGLIIPIIFIVGILAAVAIPAYQQYQMKANAAQTS
jgi:uncharacterized membrane protein YhaH (DUF805 family)